MTLKYRLLSLPLFLRYIRHVQMSLCKYQKYIESAIFVLINFRNVHMLKKMRDNLFYSNKNYIYI